MQEKKIFKPKLDKLYFLILIPTAALILTLTLISAIEAPLTLSFMLPVCLFVLYFFISSLFGYVELREETLFIKFGFILKKEIPYSEIRGMKKERKAYSESMISLKNAMEHVNVRYNKFDTVTVSVIDNDELIDNLSARIQK